jgi:hypothetical protein
VSVSVGGGGGGPVARGFAYMGGQGALLALAGSVFVDL